MYIQYSNNLREHSLTNNGSGPAIINKMNIYVDGELQEEIAGHNGWDSAVDELGIRTSWIHVNFFSEGDSLRVGETRALIKTVQLTDAQIRLKTFSDAIKKIDIEIFYESIYGEELYVEP